jgi:hypothetical protein
MTDAIKVHSRVTKTIKFEVTLEQKQYDKILREAVGAPTDARVEVENNYGGDIVISWTVVEYEGDD